ncbi:exonuclease domain-containing protein [Candidatus Omnitrophota bacterium]
MDKNININDIEFTVFDLETTGLDQGSGDRVVEIAGIRFKGDQRKGEFQSLVNPQRAISPGAFEVNRITPEMIRGAPKIDQVLPEFLKFIQGSCLCSYNAAFDMGFLNNELKIIANGDLGDIQVVDILKMSRRLMPELGRYPLWFVAESLGCKSRQEHRALSDAELTVAVFNKLKAKLSEKGILDYNNFTSLFGLNSNFLQNLSDQKIAKINEALNLGVRLKIRYLSGASAKVSEREVVPKEIRMEGKIVYLAGHCCLRNDLRTFRVDRILHLEII